MKEWNKKLWWPISTETPWHLCLEKVAWPLSSFPLLIGSDYCHPAGNSEQVDLVTDHAIWTSAPTSTLFPGPFAGPGNEVAADIPPMVKDVPTRSTCSLLPTWTVPAKYCSCSNSQLLFVYPNSGIPKAVQPSFWPLSGCKRWQSSKDGDMQWQPLSTVAVTPHLLSLATVSQKTAKMKRTTVKTEENKMVWVFFFGGGGGGGGGGYSVSHWVGVWHCETLTLFMRVISKFWNPVQ